MAGAWLTSAHSRHDGDVGDAATPPASEATAARLARAVLPTAADLDGGPWRAVDEVDEFGPVDAAVDGSIAAPDECLPDDFPDADVLASADVTFEHRRGDRLVQATATVFVSWRSAVRAASMLADEAFVRCFVTSVAADAELAPPVELLGPVVTTPVHRPGDGEPTASRVVSSHAVLAAIDGDQALSIAIDVGIVQSGPVVMLLWSARPQDPDGERHWLLALERCRRRCLAELTSS